VLKPCERYSSSLLSSASAWLVAVVLVVLLLLLVVLVVLAAAAGFQAAKAAAVAAAAVLAIDTKCCVCSGGTNGGETLIRAPTGTLRFGPGLVLVVLAAAGARLGLVAALPPLSAFGAELEFCVVVLAVTPVVGGRCHVGLSERGAPDPLAIASTVCDGRRSERWCFSSNCGIEALRTLSDCGGRILGSMRSNSMALERSANSDMATATSRNSRCSSRSCELDARFCRRAVLLRMIRDGELSGSGTELSRY